MEEVEGLELVRSALSEGRRGMVEAWLGVGKLQLGPTSHETDLLAWTNESCVQDSGG